MSKIQLDVLKNSVAKFKKVISDGNVGMMRSKQMRKCNRNENESNR